MIARHRGEEATEAADHDGIFRWAGLANTFFWIDPEADLIAFVWTQIQPFGIYGEAWIGEASHPRGRAD